MTDAGCSGVFRFGDFEFDPRTGCLTRSGTKIRLRHQMATALSALLEHPGEAVMREDLQRRLWPGDVLVDFEINLNTIIARLREALGDSADHPRYIETLPKRGYRFLAPTASGAFPEPSPPRRARIVVLPFANAGGDPAEEYFVDSMTDEIITALCKISLEQLAVIARTTSLHYRNSDKDIAGISRELGVDYVVEGNVRRSDGRVAVNAQLIETAGQTHVFAGTYDADMSDVFGLHARVAGDIAAHIPSVSGLHAGGLSRNKPTEDLTAYQLYLQGRHHMYRLTPDRLRQAKECFEEAIARDPKFALALDALGELHWWTGFFGYAPPRQAGFVGLGAVLRALEIDPTLAETHTLLGQFRQKVDYNWPEVRREMMLALDMDPSSPLVRIRYAVSYLLPHAQLKEAVLQVEKALEVDPMSILARFWLSCFLWLDRDFDRGMKEAEFAASLDPGAYLPRYMIANIHRESGRLEEAITHQRLSLKLSGGQPQMHGWLGLALGLSGDTAGARAELQRIQEIAAKTYISPTCFVWAYVGLGEFDQALAWMDRAIEDRDSMIVPIKTYAFLDPLRADPRFSALLRKMNLET
jgi:TolB-like protein